MSRKRPYNEEDSQNDVYLLPGCYAICSCPQTQREYEFQNYFEPFSIVEVEEPIIAADGLYVADAYGNIFYKRYVSYLCCEDIVRYSDAKKDTDGLSDPEAEQESKKTRLTISSIDDDEDAVACDVKKQEKYPPYLVEEPPDDEEDHVPGTSK